MEERIYKTMEHSGALSIVVGVVSIVTGVASGVLLIISGAKLLSGKSKNIILVKKRVGISQGMPFAVHMESMGINMFHRIGYKFTNKKNPQRGMIASILGAISLVSVVLAVYLTYQKKGAAPMQYGTVILLSLVFAVTGLVLGIRACMEKDIYRFFPVLGIVLNSLTVAAGGFILYLGI